MMSPYNLRSKGKKHILTCYLKEGKICPVLDPVVVIRERVPDTDLITRGNLVTKDDKIIVKEIDNNLRFSKILLTSLCIISLSLCLYFGDIQHYVKSLSRNVTQLNINIANEASYTCEIRSLIQSVLNEPKEKNEEEEEVVEEVKEERKEKTPMSFIKEQCLSPEINNNFAEPVTSVNVIFDNENLTDYALQTRGASIVTIFDTKPYGVISLKLWGLEFPSVLSYLYQDYIFTNAPYRILMPWSKPGDCWAFTGSRGRVKIELWDEISISAISIDHIRNENFSAEYISSAPKKFSVAASEKENSRSIFLGSFEYKATGPSVQTFPISPVVMENRFRFVEVTITSNHGNQHYTCLYRFRVHGRK